MQARRLVGSERNSTSTGSPRRRRRLEGCIGRGGVSVSTCRRSLSRSSSPSSREMAGGQRSSPGWPNGGRSMRSHVIRSHHDDRRETVFSFKRELYLVNHSFMCYSATYLVEKKKLGFDRDRVHYRLLSRPSPPRCSRATGTMGETAKLSGAELEEKRKVPMPLSKPPS